MQQLANRIRTQTKERLNTEERIPCDLIYSNIFHHI